MILTKVVFVMMTSLIISISIGIILIPILKKLKEGQRLSIYLEERHKSKQGTPTMGGLIFILSTMITLFIMLMASVDRYITPT